jgi:ribulose-5-phosphate 4-epimerase/fuculose-1-phosphate aldolase
MHDESTVSSLIEQSEFDCRRDVAAAYRLLHMYGLSDLTDGFVAATVGTEEVVIGGYGALPELVNASSLHRRSWREEPGRQLHGGVDIDALRFCRAAFAGRPDWRALIHAHTPQSMVFSALRQELTPISQWGLMFYRRTAYTPFDEDVSSDSACAQIESAARSGCEVYVMRNHGVLVPGRSVADAFVRLYRLEQAMSVQLGALATSAAMSVHKEPVAASWSDAYWRTDGPVEYDGKREWAALLAKLDKAHADFRE